MLLRLATAPPRVAARTTTAAATAAMGAAHRLVRAASAALDLGPQRHGRHVWADRGPGFIKGLIEVRGLADGGAGQRGLGEAVQAALSGVRGVRWARVNAVTGHVLVLFDEGAVQLSDVIASVAAVEEDHGTAGGGWSRQSPPHPADPAALAGAVAALAADCAGLAAAAAGRLAGVGPVAPVVRAVVGLVEAQPRLRRLAEQALGPTGTDLAVGVGSGVVNGLTEGVGPLLVTGLSHALLVAEVRSRRAVWAAREAELCTAPGGIPEHPPLKADRPTPFPDGPVEGFADRMATASLAVAGLVLAGTGDAGRAAALLLVGVPPAARLGRDAFAATLARRLAAHGVVPMDPGAYRRLDRVTAVVVDAAAVGAGSGLRVRILAGADPGGGDGCARDVVARLQAAGHGVLVVTTDDNDALAAADVALSVQRDGEAVGWTADLLCGPDPGPVRTLLAAVPVARRISRRAVWLAGAGSAAAAALTVLVPGAATDLTMQPVYLTGLLAQLDGASAAERLAARRLQSL